MPTYSLIPHPDFPSGAIDALSVTIERPDIGALSLAFRASGDLANVLVPDEVAPGFQDGLWRHSCFEAFLGDEARLTYIELNMSPSGRFAAYDFDDYRAGMRAKEQPQFSLFSRWSGDGWLEMSWLVQISELAEDNYRRLGLSAVIEELDGTKSYWALAHAPGPPDFHNPACFIATLPPPAAP